MIAKGVVVSIVLLLVIPRTILCLACSQSYLPKPSSALYASSDSLFAEAPRRLQMPRLNIFQRVTFSWVKALMEVGNKKPLEVDDLWALPENRQMSAASQQYEELFQSELLKPNATLTCPANASILGSYWASPITRSLLRMYKWDFINSGLLKAMNTLVQFLPSLIIARLLKHIDTHNSAALPPLSALTWKTYATNKGFLLASMLLLTLCAKTIIENQYFDLATTSAASIRGTTSAAVFKKSLRLSPSGRQNNTVGEIVNLSQLDTSRMEQVASTIHILWDGTLQVVGYTALLLHFLGPAVFAGIAAMVLTIPLNTYFLKKISGLKSKMLKFTDQVSSTLSSPAGCGVSSMTTS